MNDQQLLCVAGLEPVARDKIVRRMFKSLLQSVADRICLLGCKAWLGALRIEIMVINPVTIFRQFAGAAA